jgi:predicted metalloprotease with PDZ domain
MHVAGRLHAPATVTVTPAPGWTTVSTGLAPVPGKPHTFTAADFDILYDSPILAGTHEVIPFEVRGIRHELAGNGLGVLDRARFVADLQKMIESAATLMGDIPYSQYTFLVIGPGGGGLEHLNSTAVTIGTAPLNTRDAYVRWLAFITHEYFHHYNVKRIRPIALGPFDYDRENYTRMLWVSEGLTVYYEDLVLNRAGLLSREEVLARAGETIARFENAPGRLYQSATESSFDTWLKFFARSPHISTTTISYYDKGAALGLLLDLAIRHHSANRQSLDDVMRALYRVYYKEKQRGFTDAEFREACEKAAGVPLTEIFDRYAATTCEIDYARYLGYAGLAIDTSVKDGKGGAWGASVQDQAGAAVVTSIAPDSPAARAGLSVQDEVVAVDGRRATSRSVADAVAARKTGDRLRLLISRRGTMREVEVTLGAREERAFRIAPKPAAGPLERAILESWLK